MKKGSEPVAGANPGPRNADERMVRCPSCGRMAVYGPSNPARPFCSERCRGNDFASWANEGYRVAANPEPDDERSES